MARARLVLAVMPSRRQCKTLVDHCLIACCTMMRAAVT
jgi:hypothetical protein